MGSDVVEIFKEDKCQTMHSEECLPNFTWQPEVYNYTLNESWPPEPMSPIIPIITTLYSVVFVVGLVGNCLVMYVIIR